MRDIIKYLHESTSPQPFIKKLYRANIGRLSDKNDIKSRIGDVTTLTYKSYSNSDKSFTFGEPREGYGSDWTFALEIKEKDNDSKESIERFLTNLNKDNKFYQYFLDYISADDEAKKAKKEYESKKWTLESLLTAIKADKDLMSLKHDYRIDDVWQQKSKDTKIKAIYVDPYWRIFIKDNKILVERASWHIYEVPNLQSLYKVLSANSTSDSSESQRQAYSILYTNKI